MTVTSVTFAERYGPWGVVLGASEGLGEAYARGLAQRGMNVVVAARRTGALQRVADDIAAANHVETSAVTLDLASPSFLDELRAVTDPIEVGFVVYNGASGYVGPLTNQADESMHAIVAVNCTGPLMVCAHFGSKMVSRGRGGIVIMGSAAGLAGAAFNTAYAAS